MALLTKLFQSDFESFQEFYTNLTILFTTQTLPDPKLFQNSVTSHFLDLV